MFNFMLRDGLFCGGLNISQLLPGRREQRTGTLWIGAEVTAERLRPARVATTGCSIGKNRSVIKKLDTTLAKI
jgi:hypothetical protein